MITASGFHRPGQAGFDPTQHDRRQPPDLQAGQARPSDRGAHYHPTSSPLQLAEGVENTHSGGTFLFRSTPGHFYSGLTIRKV